MNPFLLAFRILTARLSGCEQRLNAVGRMTIGIMAFFTFSLFSPAAQAQVYTQQTLHSFTGGTADGASPQAGLCSVNGVIYGTTYAGGSAGVGTIFSYNPTTNTETTVYTFGVASSDGANPWTALLNVNGILYGTAAFGGSNPGLSGNGIIFSFNPANKTEKILHLFQGGSDGAYPQGTLIEVDGKLYGTTASGNTSYGNVYVINPDGTGYQSLYDFQNNGINGLNPVAGLINVNGTLIGSTYYAGPTDGGTLFSYTPASGPFYTYAYFTGGSNGAHPRFEMTNLNGVLYGTTTGNNDDNGTIFSINPIGTGFQSVYSFAGGSSDGATPYTNLVAVNGILYGTTQAGGSGNSGTIFAFDPTKNTEKLAYSFTGKNGNGAAPQSGLLLVNGKYYGTTSAGGSANDGTLYVFKIAFTAPITHNDIGTAYYKTPLVIAAPGVLGNDDNGGEGPMKASLVTNPTHGTLTFNSDGSFSYMPTGTYIGTDSFTYQAANPVGKSNIATVTLTVRASAPIAANNSNLVKYETALTVPAPGVLGNDDNGGSSPMTATLVSNVSHGTLVLNANGGFTYTPSTGFVGIDSFTYQAINSAGNSNTATATLNVQASAPIAHDDRGHGYYNMTLTVSSPGVLGNDDSGGKGPITATLVSMPAHGTLTLNSDGSFTYTPSKGFVGTDSFTYQAVNSLGAGTTATCLLTISPVAPIAVNNSNNVKQNSTFTAPAPGVLGNDDNGGSTPLTAVLVTTTSHGTLTLSSNGAFTYTPNAGFSGTDSFTYQAVNSVGKSNIATATLIVQ